MGVPWWYILYNFLLWLVVYLFVNKKWKTDFYTIESLTNKKQYNCIFIIILAYSMFTFFGGDKVGYKEMVEGGYKDAEYYEHYAMEEIYVWLSEITGASILLWKFVVYGFSILFTYLTIKRLKIENYASLIAFIFCCMISYGSTRAVLAYSVYLFGFTFLSKKIISKIIGYSLILFSLILHSSMVLPVVLSFLIWIKLTRKRIIILVLVFPILLSIFNNIINILAENPLFVNSHIGYKFNTYMSMEGSNRAGSFLMRVYTMLNFCTFIPLLLWSLKVETKQLLPPPISKVVGLCFLLVYSALIIRFSDLPNTYTIFTRYFTMMPFFIYITFPYIVKFRVPKSYFFRIYTYIPFLRNFIFFMIMMYYESFK